MIDKFNALPDAAKIVIGITVILLLCLMAALVIIVAAKTTSKRVKIPKQLQIGAVPIMNDREFALKERLEAIVRRHPNYELHAKMSTRAIIAAWDDLPDKVRRHIESKFIEDAHDFVITDPLGYAIAIIELDSSPRDKREEQARQAGIPIIRVDDPHVEPDKLEDRFKRIFK